MDASPAIDMKTVFVRTCVWLLLFLGYRRNSNVQEGKHFTLFFNTTIWYALSARSTVGPVRTDVYELSILGKFWKRNFFPFRTDWVFISMKFFNMVYSERFEHQFLSSSNKEMLSRSVTRKMV
jgi:hypothetical protein